MGTVLQINSSMHGEAGQSTRLADELVARLQQQNPAFKRVVRDLADEPVPHLDANRFAAFTTPAGERNAQQQAVVAQSDRLISELREAEVIAGITDAQLCVPSQLKAYFDHVARAGETRSDIPKRVRITTEEARSLRRSNARRSVRRHAAGYADRLCARLSALYRDRAGNDDGLCPGHRRF